MDLLGPPSGAKTTLWDHFEGLISPLALILQSSDDPEPLQWASGMNLSDFRVLAFAILGSVLDLLERFLTSRANLQNRRKCSK